MKFTKYSCINEFYNATHETIMKDEAQTILPLGNIIIGKNDEAGMQNQSHWFMATVSDEKGICLTAIMTPPKEMTLYAANNENDPRVISCLIDGIGDTPLPGIMAEKQLVELFAAGYAQKHNKHTIITMNQRIYELTKVNPAIPKAKLRLAADRDMSFLPYWDSAYFSEAINRPNIIGSNPEDYLDIIRSGNVYIMEKQGVPVAMARISRELETVCYISYAFTPPYFRRRGHQTACTAALSQIGLDRGFSKIVLFTDLANTTANNIYQTIGYSPICDSLQVKFE
ncbi:MAG: GNAT family N-acetyltransferase [Defluviitaleaceae bacterium]|nr:GNAT family N-acetyltransferase [Defluviitaleaceae bacterium]